MKTAIKILETVCKPLFAIIALVCAICGFGTFMFGGMLMTESRFFTGSDWLTLRYKGIAIAAMFGIGITFLLPLNMFMTKYHLKFPHVNWSMWKLGAVISTVLFLFGVCWSLLRH